MSESSESSETNENKFSLTAFLFMPQFKYSFRAAAHLYPVFIQLVATVFSATGLLPKNHEAMRYGSTDVKKKYSFRQLVGEAWYHLRRSRATPRQWAMYFSVLIMIFCFATAIVGITGRVFLGMGVSAEAQLFTLGALNTSIQNGQSSASTMLFDKRMDQSQLGTAYNDWGLFLLDKIVRESAQTPAVGGTLQNAFSSIIQVYNTAITVVAAIMIFWIIVSVVVDTAKTGVLGGGRHNMVWAPIRIVFALGLMIPLGSVGYSSGQYCVMKLAEWGSNLGTNGWNAYVSALTMNKDFLAPVTPGGATSLVNAIAEMRTCQVAYNSYVGKALSPVGTPLSGTQRQLVGPRNTWSSDGSTLTHALTNANDAALCGSLNIAAPGGASPVNFPGWVDGGAEPSMGSIPSRPSDTTFTGAGGKLDDASSVNLGLWNTVTELGSSIASSWLSSFTYGNPMMGPQIQGTVKAFAQLQEQMRQQVVNQVISTLTTKVEPGMLKFACVFANNYVAGGSAVVSTAVGVDTSTFNTGSPLCPNATAGTDCGAQPLPAAGTPATGKYVPNYSCHAQAISDLSTDLSTILATALSSGVAWFSGGNFQTEMQVYGWASAGAFYNKVTEINAQAQSLSQPVITYTPGKVNAGMADCYSGYSSVGDCSGTHIDYETALVMQEYTRWYEEYAATGAGAAGLGTDGTAGVGAQSTQGDKPNGMSMWKIGLSLFRGGVNAVASLIETTIFGPDSRNQLLINLVGSVNDNTLPLANLAKTGVGMIIMGGTIVLACSVLQGAVGAIPLAGAAIANSAVFAFVTATAASLITEGMMLTFFTPIMPFIRSAFATLTWMVSIFEAVCMVPIAALAHLTTEGEGLAAGARQCWILWLNVLVRPILFVMGFVGAFIVYNAWVCYFTVAFNMAAAASPLQDNIFLRIIAMFFNTTVYVGTCFATANSVFKMVDIIPNALMRWMPGGSVDHSFDDGAQAAQGYGQTAASTMSRGYGAGLMDAGYAYGKSTGAATTTQNADGTTTTSNWTGSVTQNKDGSFKSGTGFAGNAAQYGNTQSSGDKSSQQQQNPNLAAYQAAFGNQGGGGSGGGG
jgi:hypothetical protein